MTDDINRSKDLFWDRRAPKALLQCRNYDHNGRAAYAVFSEMFYLYKDPEDVTFEDHLGNKVSATLVVSERYEDEVLEEFAEVVQEMTDADISITKITTLEDDFLGDMNKQFRVDIRHESEEEKNGLLKRFS